MKILILSLSILLLTTTVYAQKDPPIIDMHLHAYTADGNGPPPLGLCVPLLSHIPPHDPTKSWEEVFIATLKETSCPDPIWSPATDKEVMIETIEVLEKRNIIGVLSGPPDRVLRWQKKAPASFIPSVQFQIGRDDISPDSMRTLFKNGDFAVLVEGSNVS